MAECFNDFVDWVSVEIALEYVRVLSSHHKGWETYLNEDESSSGFSQCYSHLLTNASGSSGDYSSLPLQGEHVEE